jgi:PAS domain S-box-containing protein
MSSDSYYATMAAMRDSFRKNLPARIGEIESVVFAARNTDKSVTPNPLDQCHALAHKLAGAAGTFGYPDVAKIARNFEHQVKEYLEFVEPLDDDCWAILNNFLVAMKSCIAENEENNIFTKSDWSVSSTEFGPKDKTAKTVIVIDDDVQATEALKLQLMHFGYSVIVANDHQKLPDLLNEYNPSAVILDISFPGDPLGGINIVKSLREEDKLHCPLIYISVRGDLEVRLEAIRVEADGYFTKPFDLMDLLQSLDSLITPEQEEPYRVVVVDDDQEVATFNAAALNEAGIVTVVVTDPMKVMPPIRELRPDLILMDLQMPGCTGFELAKSIRFDKTYVQTPIVFLTGSDIADTWLKFVKSGGDELLRKTISTQELVAIIYARCKRSRQLLKAINEFKLSEARFRSVAQTAQEAIVTTDVDSRIVFWNQAAENLFGYSQEEIVGHDSDILFVDSNQSGSKSWSGMFESEIVRQDKGLVPVEISTSDWSVNEASFVTFIFRDITERRDSQDQLI